ncbi:hypothetical protein BUALT_Bualt19G0053700 [Buddleja alternifolia]|uniref:Myb/SANT-like domain-containing protein n=1 Tax=Buddleja alternifolia TaxID=168488 RepID=A0AAV6W578_9LAMI|nr:hypothetical protein BUALT_Bualt19G0053700 [Buddleja alternifolia]
MPKRSGFGWNSTSNTITVSRDEVWDNYVKSDVNARTMRHKSWPLFDDWCEIFGKDRATRENAESFDDVAKELEHNEKGKKKMTPNKVIRDHTPHFKNRDFEEVQSTSVSCGDASARAKNNSSKGKRKLADDGDAKSRKAVFEALAEIDNLDIEQRTSISKALVNNTKNLDLFFSLPTDGKSAMVKMMLAGT